MKNGIGKPSNIQRTFELIPPHRKRAVLRKCFDRIDKLVSNPQATAGEVLQSLKALDMVLGLAQGHTPTDKLAEALMRPDDMTNEEFFKSPVWEAIIAERRKYADKLQ